MSVVAYGAAAQSNSASRTIPSTAPAQPEGPFVRFLRNFEPAKETPLTPKTQLHIYLKDTVGPITFLREAAAAGIRQAANSPEEWGGGMEGYGKRFGSNMGYNAVRCTIMYGTAALLHEDNRYFASGKTAFWPRTSHALASPFVTRHRDGRTGFAISKMAGYVGGTIVSREWMPPSRQGPQYVFTNIATSIAGTAGFNVVREFMPDLIRRIQHK